MTYSTSSLLLEYWQTLVNGAVGKDAQTELADRMSTIGGYLVDSRSGEWLRLAPLRGRIIDWLKPEDNRVNARLVLSRYPGLLTPERHRRYSERNTRDAEVSEAAADLVDQQSNELSPEASATWPTSGFAYWRLNVKSGGELNNALSLDQEPTDPLQRRAEQIVNDIRVRSNFVRLLRHRGPSDDRMHDLDRDALFDYFTDLLERGGQHSSAVAIVYRALKAATYQRVGQYLDCIVPGERERALQADLRMGDDYFTLVVDLVNPLVAAWLSVENYWLDDIRADRGVVTPLIGRQVPPGRAAEAPARSLQLAALFELAYDDIEPRTDRVWAPVEAAAGHMVTDCLFELLLADDEAAAQLDGAVLSNQLPGPVRPSGARLLTVAEPRSSRSPEHGRAERRDGAAASRAPRRQTEVVSMLRDLAAAPPGRQTTRWLQQVEFVHEAATALQTGGGLTMPEVYRVGADLAGHVVHDIGVNAHHPDELVHHVSILSMLGILLSAAKEYHLDILYRPALRRLRARSEQEGLSFPLLPTLERSITIMHSKDNNFRDAEDQLLRAIGYLNHVLKTTPPDDETAYINARESAQQIALQASGMYMRLTELYLAEPELLAELAAEERWRVLRETCWLGLKSSAYAYQELKYIEKAFTLPDRKIISRSATKRWYINTRCMHMRGLLLQAMLNAVEVDRAPARLRPELEQGTVRALVDAVPEVFREATSVDVSFTSWGSTSPAMVNELTRSAMHYAFMSGMRPLLPGDSPAPLPQHLSGGIPRRGADGRTCYDFDLNGATDQLRRWDNNAGILACIRMPKVRAVLERRSIQADVLRERGIGREALRDTSPYRQWVRRDPELRRLLSRNLTADMARHVGAEFDPRRMRVQAFLERHDQP
jgi:hypothetical protein